MTLDFLEKATTEELEIIRATVENEFRRRKNEKKEQLWKEFCEVTEKYICEFGEIRVVDEFGDDIIITYSHSNRDFSTVGEIRL